MTTLPDQESPRRLDYWNSERRQTMHWQEMKTERFHSAFFPATQPTSLAIEDFAEMQTERDNPQRWISRTLQ